MVHCITQCEIRKNDWFTSHSTTWCWWNYNKCITVKKIQGIIYQLRHTSLGSFTLPKVMCYLYRIYWSTFRHSVWNGVTRWVVFKNWNWPWSPRAVSHRAAARYCWTWCARRWTDWTWRAPTSSSLTTHRAATWRSTSRPSAPTFSIWLSAKPHRKTEWNKKAIK